MPDHDDTDALIRLIGGWRTRRAVVAGDFMLDHHVFGSAARLSPDAPVPVLAAQREQFVPGGAANVALDLAALRCRVDCLGVVGRDPEARTLKTALRDAKCGVTGLVPSSDRPTSVKHSFIGLAQQKTPQKMFRVDDERAAPVPDEVRRRLVSAAEKLIPAADVLCLQDHDKGVLTDRICQQLIRIARRHRVPVLVDPAAIESFDRYRGATCITPNRFEAAQAVGRGQSLQDDRALRSVAARMLEKLNLTAVVLTLDRSGALLQERKRRPVLLPTAVREVYDVTGAGDMVLSMLAAAVANGAGWPDALRLANVAAGLEVERFGTVPIDLDEIMLELLQRRHAPNGKVRTLDQLLPELRAHRKRARTIVFTNGCFDILHAGHISYLRQARRHGDLMVVAVNSDASIRRIKGAGRPVNSAADRLMVLSELESIDYLVEFDENTPMKLIRSIRPDVLVKGGDYKRSEVVGGDWVRRHGGRIELVDLIRGRSTTNVIRQIRK